jgi:HicB-like protein involved in pilus formation
MQIDGHIQALREDLARVAALGDEAASRAAELLSVAIESSLARRIQDVLAEAALELNSQLDEAHVEVRIAGRDPELVLVREAAEPEAPADTLDARITLRLPEDLKRRVEEAAARDGISVNTWIVRSLAREAGSARSAGGVGGRNRLTGYGRN